MLLKVTSEEREVGKFEAVGNLLHAQAGRPQQGFDFENGVLVYVYNADDSYDENFLMQYRPMKGKNTEKALLKFTMFGLFLSKAFKFPT